MAGMPGMGMPGIGMPGMGMGMPGMGGPGMGMGGFRHGMHPPPPTKAAVFSFSRGDMQIMIKCADEEPTRACVDAASALIDKLGTSSPR
ncbi:MAG: hypothetical protein NVSMB18_00980 [Acetobacteraceae bacterium]